MRLPLLSQIVSPKSGDLSFRAESAERGISRAACAARATAAFGVAPRVPERPSTFRASAALGAARFLATAACARSDRRDLRSRWRRAQWFSLQEVKLPGFPTPGGPPLTLAVETC